MQRPHSVTPGSDVPTSSNWGRPSLAITRITLCALVTFIYLLALLAVMQPERFVDLGIDPSKGVLLFGPPGTGKILCARAVANRTDATFIRVIGSELVQKYVGKGARMVRELFEMVRSKKACIIFFMLTWTSEDSSVAVVHD